MTESFSGEEIRYLELPAALIGIESEGKFTSRGKGVLVLTDNYLWFRKSGAEEPPLVYLDTLVDVTTVRYFMRKKRMSPLICVAFRSAIGLDSAAWRVDRPQQWQHEVTAAARRAFRAQ